MLIPLAEIPGLGVLATDTRTVLGWQALVTPKQVSRTKMSSQAQAEKSSSGVRFVAIEANATKRPSALKDMPPLFPGLEQFAAAPSFAIEIRMVPSVQPMGSPLPASRT